MADLIRKPGVEITQVVTTTPTTQVTPTLAPCIVGPAFEVMETTVDGAANSASVIDGLAYNQNGLSISPSSFQTNHADIDEVSVIGLTDEISAALFKPNGDVINLDPDNNSAFLEAMPVAHKPAVFFTTATQDVSLRVMGTGFSQAQIIQTGAAASASTIAQQFIDIGLIAKDISGGTSGYDLFVTLPDVSASYGPNAYLSIKEEVGNGFVGSAATKDIQVNGAGLYAEPSAGLSTTSTVQVNSGEFYVGDLSANPAAADLANYAGGQANNADNSRPAWLPISWSGAVSSAKIAELPNFPAFNAIDLQSALPTRNGDVLVADGVQIGQVLSILPSSIELGNVNTQVSQYASDGSIIKQVYDRVALTKDFNPKYVYFLANALSPKELDGTVNAELEINISASVVQASAGEIDVTIAGNADLSGLALLVKTYQSGAETDTFTFVFPNGQGDDAASLVQEMTNQIAIANEARLFTVSENGGTITFATTNTGADYSIKLLSAADGSTALSGTLIVTGSGVNEVEDAGSDLVSNIDLNDTNASLSVFLDDNPYEYNVSVGGRLVQDLVDALNNLVGYPVASIGTSGVTTNLVLSSSLVGRSSSISVDTFAPLGIVPSSASGSGRPNPNISVNSAGMISIGAQIIRNNRTGLPLVPTALGSITIGVAYRGLRLDLSTAANQPGLINIYDINDLANQLSPVDTRNPLALGIYYAMLNAGNGVTVSAIGVDDVSSSEPEGTAIAYMRAAEFIEAHEVYGVVPLTHSEEVIGIFNQHVNDMSAATAKHERVLISAPEVPERRNSIVLSSGESAEYANTPNLVDLGDGSLEDAAESNGIDAALPIPAVLANMTEVVLQIEIGDSTLNYSVSSISGSNVAVRVSGMPNGDGFYSTLPISSSFSDAKYSLFIRGAKLYLPGTTILDRQALATTVRDSAQQYANSRQLRLFPDTVQSVIGGVEQSIPMYYFACAIAGETADLTAETPFSRRSMDGFTNVSTHNLTSNQLDIVSAGNCVIEVEAQGMAPSIRIQSTTAPDAIETREYSIVKAVDSFAKQLRGALKGRVGLFNITQTYIDETSTIVDIICQGAVANGLLASATVSKAEQSSLSPDTMLVEVNVGVLYPANYIKLTLFV
jgi:hypothetical protein